MIAYKFLARGAIAPVSRVPWPIPRGGAPGAWLEAGDAVVPCRAGVHACRAPQLAYWLHEELWTIELEEPLVPGLDCVVAPRGRLLERIDAWSEAGGAQRFAAAVRDHAAAAVGALPAADGEVVRGYVDDASWHVKNGILDSPALAALCAAMAAAKAVERTSGPGPSVLEDAYRDERGWQSRWIAREMGLDTTRGEG